MLSCGMFGCAEGGHTMPQLWAVMPPRLVLHWSKTRPESTSNTSHVSGPRSSWEGGFNTRSCSQEASWQARAPSPTMRQSARILSKAMEPEGLLTTTTPVLSRNHQLGQDAEAMNGFGYVLEMRKPPPISTSRRGSIKARWKGLQLTNL